MPRNLRFALARVVVAALVAAVATALDRTRVFDYLEKILDDVAVAYHTPNAAEPHPEVVVVAVDETTIRTLPARSPIDRGFLAELIRVIDRGRPAAIGLDVLLDLPSNDPAKDAALAAALADARAPVVMVAALKRGERRPLAPPFEDSGAEVALGNMPVDRIDRTWRDFRTAFADDDGTLHDVMAAVLARHAGAEVERSTADRRVDWYGRPGWQDRTLADGVYAGPPPIATYSALALVNVPATSALLRDKVVIVGATFDGSHDFLRTPFELLHRHEEAFPGVYAHAQVAAQLIDGRARPVAGPGLALAVTLGGVLIGMVFALARLAPLAALAAMLALPVAWVAAVFLVRRETELALPVVAPTLAAWLAFAAFAVMRARHVERRRR